MILPTTSAVHQIWIGEPLPERVSRSLESVRSAATAAGWQRKLWGWKDIAEAFGADPGICRLSSDLAAAPDDVRLRVIAADYARLLILAREGGLFLDADFDAVGAFPQLPDGGADVLGVEDYTIGDRPQGDTLHMANGVLWVPTDRSRTALQLACRAAAARLQTVRRADVRSVIHYLGPAWLRKELLPLWRAEGLTADLLPAGLIGKETDPAPLLHHALASWRFPGRVLPPKEPALSSVTDSSLTPHGTHLITLPAEAPQAPNPSIVHRPKLPTAVRQFGQKHRFCPQGEQPWGGCESTSIVHESPLGSLGAAAIIPRLPPLPRPLSNPFFSLPRDCTRIIILSNVTRDFPFPALTPDDVCIHLNNAKHAVWARERFPWTRHVLFMRSNGDGVNSWFAPRGGEVQGFHAAVTLRCELYRSQAWWREWQASGGGNPTTGFIAARMLKEWHPDVEIILAGFAPERDCGTFRSPVHPWNKEAAWYRSHPRAFTILPPTPAPQAPNSQIAPRQSSIVHESDSEPRLLLLVCSCQRKAAERQACRETWLSDVPESVSYRFLVGGVNDPGEADTLFLKGVDDSYPGLPAKIIAAFRRALDIPDWDFLGKCDDDTYLILPRLLPHLTPDCAALGKFTWAHRPWGGGAGYFLRRDTVERVLAAAEACPMSHGKEDHYVCSLLLNLNIPITNLPLLNQFARDPRPTKTNSIISAHQLSPAALRSLHAKLTRA